MAWCRREERPPSLLCACKTPCPATVIRSLSACTFVSFRYEEALENISDQALQEVSRALSQRGYAALTTDRQTSLKGQVKSSMDKDNAVRHVIAESLSLSLTRI